MKETSKYEIKLTDEELIQLDGSFGKEVQLVVDQAKQRVRIGEETGLPSHLAELLSNILTEANEKGVLVYQHRKISYCLACGASPDPAYVLYKSGRRKGEPNLNKKRYIDGIEFAQRFVRMQGHIATGACADCVEGIKDVLIAKLGEGQPVQLPPILSVDGSKVYGKMDRKLCGSCGWSGHEAEMVWLRTAFGDGWYAGGCPDCDSRNLPFSRHKVEKIDGYQVVEVDENNYPIGMEKGNYG